MHPALRDDLKRVESLVAVATQFLADSGIEIGGEQYQVDLRALQEGEHEFAKAVMFAKHLYPNADYPAGMSDDDIDPRFASDYLPSMAAVAVIETAILFRRVSDSVAARGVASIEACHNYALYLWHIESLAETLQMSEVYKDGFRLRQQSIASKPRRKKDALTRLIEEILERHPQWSAVQVVREIKREQCNGVIETVTESNIEWYADDGQIKKTKISAIKDRVSRTKAKKDSR
ncbi:hypothetical protein AB4Y36_08240 [Paraburkholderia sp. BR10936]|uniref:hypothetical protein n=1 Tax=Paraburkholderia sp. BR10936 TaxID=3236993 RepID=UPI0034D25CB7